MKKSSPSENMDISSLKAELAELHAIVEEQKREIFYLKSIINKLPGSIYWKDENGVYLGCNDFVLDMAGSKEVIGKTDFDLPWSDYAEEIGKIDATVIEENRSIELEEYPTLANGQQIIMLTNKTPLKDEQGKTVGIIGISVDITQKKQREQQEIAISLLNIASHEIKTPLNNIYGLAQLLKLKEINEDNTQLVDNILSEVKRATALLSDMVDLFDPTFTVDDLYSIDAVSLTEVINSIVPEITFLAPIEFIFQVHPKLPSRIKINVLKLRNVLKILLQNSAEQTQQGFIKLLFNSIKVQDKPALYIELIDTSPGIYPENKDYVFNALGVKNHLDKDFLYHKPYIKLTMAKRLIESMDGKISLINHPDQGSEFEIVIPYQTVAENLSDYDTPLKSFSHRASEVDIPAGLNIMVVEDDKTTNQLLTDMFKQFNCKVKQVYTGNDALTMLNSSTHTFDIISLDITLPDINGTQVLKKLPQNQKAAVIAITSHATKADIDYFYQQGFMAVLTKPINLDEIKDLLQAYARMLCDD